MSFQARFRLRFAAPRDEDVRGEIKGKAIALALTTGDSHVYFHLKPRLGIVLNSINVAFFHNRTWPLRILWFFKPNNRLKTTTIRATGLGVMGAPGDPRKWVDCAGVPSGEDAVDFVFKPPLKFTSHKRKTFRVSFFAADCMHNWDGILVIQLEYEHRGSLGESSDLPTKVFVRDMHAR